VSSFVSHRIDVGLVRRALREPSAGIEPGPDDRLAAVAAVLRDGGQGAEVLLIRRATHAGDPWSGHMALPGGRRDSTDPDLLFTARRETREELGLDLERDASLIGRLEILPALARAHRVELLIAPYVFELARDVPLRLNYEVEEAIWAPLGPLLRGERSTIYPYEWEGQRWNMPAYDVDGRIVWGLTYRMLATLFEQIEQSLNSR
jgi:8-oxo-dGTP pyrophosphatase MutT (NUDIX family)